MVSMFPPAVRYPRWSRKLAQRGRTKVTPWRLTAEDGGTGRRAKLSMGDLQRGQPPVSCYLYLELLTGSFSKEIDSERRYDW